MNSIGNRKLNERLDSSCVHTVVHEIHVVIDLSRIGTQDPCILYFPTLTTQPPGLTRPLLR